ncbi:MAG: PTS sugar transporter subunit IIA [Acidobacteria bacterium]|nr:PTS sugar transporter subunit IIA [Acidobacteriota bacterium]MCA1611274.1 PTS sugar transporter subunit IIA [Acidobacteriota bacterium]
MSATRGETAGFLQGLVNPGLIFTGLPPGRVEEVLTDLSRRVAEAGAVRDPADLARRLLDRERLGCTGLGAGIAIPHCKLKDLGEIVLAVASCPGGADFRSPDGVSVTLIFLILSPAEAPALHLQALARISRLLKTAGVADSLRRAQTPGDLYAAIKEAESAVPAVRP